MTSMHHIISAISELERIARNNREFSYGEPDHDRQDRFRSNADRLFSMVAYANKEIASIKGKLGSYPPTPTTDDWRDQGCSCHLGHAPCGHCQSAHEEVEG
jgi:hypothetical protein